MMTVRTWPRIGAVCLLAGSACMAGFAAAQDLSISVEVAQDRSFVPIQSYAVGEVGDHAIFVSGLRNLGLHVFGANAFPVSLFNDQITVVNTATGAIAEGGIGHLPQAIRLALLQTAPGFIQYDDTLYLYGGYGPTKKSYDTRPTVTAIDLAAVRDAVLASQPVPASAFAVMASKSSQTTGPAMAKLENGRFVLVGGTRFAGEYASANEVNEYRESVYVFDRTVSMSMPVEMFTMDGGGGESPLHRRDVNVLPLTVSDGNGGTRAGYTVTTGAFQNGSFLWTQPLYWAEGDAEITMDADFTQHQSNYTTARVSLYSENKGENRQIHFSGISAYDYANGEYLQNFFSPWTAEINELTVDDSGFVAENIIGSMPWPLSNSDLVIEHSMPVNDRGQILLDGLPRDTPTLIGRIYGGIAAEKPGDFPATYGSDDVYNVFLTVTDPAGTPADLTNVFVTFGFHLGGGLPELMASDNQYYITRSNFGFSVLEPDLMQMRVDAVSTVSNPTSFDLAFECRINAPNGVCRLRLRNWTTNQLNEVANYNVNFTESTYTVEGLDASQYIRASDGKIELHPKQVVPAVFSALGFDTRIDFIEFEVF